MTRCLLALPILLIALYGAPVAAQTACGRHDAQTETLKTKYGERRIGRGISGPTAAVEVWANPETGTWSILVVYPNGVSCLKASGGGWQSDSETEKGLPT